MRKLIIMRGLPGSGKSTIIKDNNLDLHTVSSDAIRLIVASTNMNIDGTVTISAKEDKWVWEKIYEILELRFKKGLFTVFDATNIKTSDIAKVKQLANKYNYKTYCLTTENVPIETVKKRNANRESYKYVPESVIEKMNEKMQHSTIPNDIQVITTENIDSVFYKADDVSNYEAVHFIGDIHGCYDALIELINEEINPNELYVFCGDYVDRGIQNAKTLNFLFDISQKSNVIFLEGNHERHLRDWCDNQKIVSDTFKNETKVELETQGISIKKTRKFCENLKEFIYITYNGQKIFASHGGIPNIPERIDFLSAEQAIRGVGRYTDCEAIETAFAQNCPDTILVHGHRNIEHNDINPHPNVYNLENSVEFGGTMRMVTFTKDKTTTREIVNMTFKKKNPMNHRDVENLVKTLRENEYIKENKYNDVSSFNFTRKAFEKAIWNQQTITARGLYIDTNRNEIVARSYNKFFRVDENEETQKGNLKNKLAFPVTAYKKENGFLGIFSSYRGKPFFATKSCIDGDFNGYFQKIMHEKYGEDIINKMNLYCNKNNCTMVFEVIDIENDPHIAKYNESTAILLDIISNHIIFNKLPYKQLQEVSKELQLEVKSKEEVFHTYKELDRFISSISTNKKYCSNNQIEGYVLEDSKGYMFKLKTGFYSFWKHMRSITNSVMKHGKYKHENEIENETAKEYYQWLIDKYNTGFRFDGNRIIELREMFKTEKGIVQ